MAPILEIRELYKNFGQTEVLKDIDIVIESGDFLVLVGPSGCGKSTLLNCIAGLEPISGGRILIDGREYRSDVIILPEGIKTDWWRLEGHLLQVADLKDVLDAAPDVLIVGTGSSGLMRVADEVAERLTAEGLELVAAGETSLGEVFLNTVGEAPPS